MEDNTCIEGIFCCFLFYAVAHKNVSAYRLFLGLMYNQDGVYEKCSQIS